MGSVRAGGKGLAAGGGLIALAAVVACESPGYARTANNGPDTMAAETPKVAPAASTSSRGLCAGREAAYFSCQVGAKQVAVCRVSGGAEYRYGLPGKVELASRELSLGTRGFSGGGETQVTAVNGEYSYTVFDRTTRTGFGADGRNDPTFTSGLVIGRGTRILSTRAYGEETPVATAARKAISAGAFVEH